MDKRLKFSYLLDIYGSLLTEKQYDVLNAYYDEDLSITEIAEYAKVTRQAAYDLIKRAEHILLDYDEKLQLFSKYMQNLKTLEKIKHEMKTNNISSCMSLIDTLEKNL